jgi:hypothetical protein
MAKYVENTGPKDGYVWQNAYLGKGKNNLGQYVPIGPIAEMGTLTTGAEGVRTGQMMREAKKKGYSYLAATAGQRAKNQTLGGMKQTLG